MQISMVHFATDVPGIFTAEGNVDVAVAFVSELGLDLVRPTLQQKLESGRRVRLLLDLEEGVTDLSALWGLGEILRGLPENLVSLP